MKRLILTIAIIFSSHSLFSQCTPDTTITSPNIYPDEITNLPEGFVGQPYVAKIDEVINKEASLNIPLYVKSTNQEIILEPSEAYAEWTKSSDNLKESMNDLFNIL